MRKKQAKHYSYLVLREERHCDTTIVVDVVSHLQIVGIPYVMFRGFRDVALLKHLLELYHQEHIT